MRRRASPLRSPLAGPQYAEQYARFWFHGGGEPRRYSFWAADAVHAVSRATGNTGLEQDLLPALLANFEGWERTNRDSSGLFHQIDDRDGMEYSLGGSGYRPTINSYQFGDAQTIAGVAESMGETEVAAKYRQKAARIKDLVQGRLWDREAYFSLS